MWYNISCWSWYCLWQTWTLGGEKNNIFSIQCTFPALSFIVVIALCCHMLCHVESNWTGKKHRVISFSHFKSTIGKWLTYLIGMNCRWLHIMETANANIHQFQRPERLKLLSFIWTEKHIEKVSMHLKSLGIEIVFKDFSYEWSKWGDG